MCSLVPRGARFGLSPFDNSHPSLPSELSYPDKPTDNRDGHLFLYSASSNSHGHLGKLRIHNKPHDHLVQLLMMRAADGATDLLGGPERSFGNKQCDYGTLPSVFWDST